MSWFARPVVTVAYTQIPDADGPALSRLAGRLPADEQQRAARFRGDDDRARFVFGRLLLRNLVAGVTGTSDAGTSDADAVRSDAARADAVRSDAIRIGIEERGRPFVVEPAGVVFVSLAHSGRYVAAAAFRRPIGIDVEECRRRSTSAEVAKRVCSPLELQRLDALAGEARERAFMAIWARKEAYGKALGVGLGFGMRAVTVGPAGSRVLGIPARWWVGDLEIDPDYAAALVVEGRRARVDLQAIDPATL